MTVTRVRTRTWVGQAVQRVEDERLLKGEGQYVGDLRREGMLHAAILRSPMAHGLLKGVDAERARTMPGVRAIITAVADGDMLRTQLAILRRLAKHDPYNTIGLQQEIAQAIVDRGSYPRE